MSTLGNVLPAVCVSGGPGGRVRLAAVWTGPRNRHPCHRAIAAGGVRRGRRVTGISIVATGPRSLSRAFHCGDGYPRHPATAADSVCCDSRMVGISVASIPRRSLFRNDSSFREGDRGQSPRRVFPSSGRRVRLGLLRLPGGRGIRGGRLWAVGGWAGSPLAVADGMGRFGGR
jgi:hypothetical protein